MQTVEDISGSVRQLGQTIRDTYSFAYNSPAKARKSLMAWAEYFQAKSMQSTMFVVGFWMALLDLLKSDHMEQLVSSVLGILESLVKLLQTEDCKLLFKSLINIAASEPIQILMTEVGKILKSIFYLMRTPEIGKFKIVVKDLMAQWKKSQEESQKRARQISKKNKSKKRTGKETGLPKSARKDTSAVTPGMMPGSTEDGTNDHTFENDNNNNDIGNIDNDRMKHYPQSAPFTPKHNSHHHNSGNDDRGRSWLGLPGFVSILSGMSPPINYDYDENAAMDPKNLSNVFNEENNGNGNVSSEEDDSFDTSENNGNNNNQSNFKYISQSTDEMGDNNNNKSKFRLSRVSKRHSQGNVYNDNNNSNGNLDDWKALIEYIDSLIDNCNISVKTGSKLRQLAWEESRELMILYKTYANDQTRFIQYSKQLLVTKNEKARFMKLQSKMTSKLEVALKNLLLQEMRNEMRNNNNNSNNNNKRIYNNNNNNNDYYDYNGSIGNRSSSNIPFYNNNNNNADSIGISRNHINNINNNNNNNNSMSDINDSGMDSDNNYEKRGLPRQVEGNKSSGLTGLASKLTSHATSYVYSMVPKMGSNNNASLMSGINNFDTDNDNDSDQFLEDIENDSLYCID